MSRHTPFYADVRSHYDLSDDFFGLFPESMRARRRAYSEEADSGLEQVRLHDRGIFYDHDDVDFQEFIRTVSLPGGCLPFPGSTVPRPRFAHTLDYCAERFRTGLSDVIQFTCAK